MDWNFLDITKLSNENKIILIGIVMTLIVALVGGCFTLMAAFVQRPGSPTSSAATSMVIVITATPQPTIARVAEVASNTPFSPIESTNAPVASVDNTEQNPVQSFSLPWSGWVISFVSRMPESTWGFLFIFMGVLGMFGSIMLFYGIQLKDYYADRESIRRGFAIGLVVIISIYAFLHGGWSSMWLGLLVSGGIVVLMLFPFTFGVTMGTIIGLLLGFSASLLYLAIPGPLDGEIITSGSIIGAALGAVLGGVLLRGSITDAL
jgi:hypothetical protein